MVYIILHNDGQYTNNSPEVIGAFEDLDASCIFGWRTVIETAQKPWKIKFYKNRTDKFADLCGLGKYYIEEWDTSSNKRLRTYVLGEDGKRYVLDAYLKENHLICEDILSEWHKEIQQNYVPTQLQNMTFVSQ